MKIACHRSLAAGAIVVVAVLSSGAADHFGWNAVPSNLRLIAWNAGHSSLAPAVSASSTGLHGFIRGPFDLAPSCLVD